MCYLYRTVLFCILIFFVAVSSFADGANQSMVLGKQVEIAPQGEYAAIHVEQSSEMIKEMRSSSSLLRSRAIYSVLAHPGDYTPPVLCLLSFHLLQQGKEKEALFWKDACILRAMSDANKTDDLSSADAVTVLRSQMQPIFEKQQFSHAERMKIAKEVVVWDEKNSRNYDARWLMLHGMGAFFQKKFDFAPKSDWSTIDKKTRHQFIRKASEDRI